METPLDLDLALDKKKSDDANRAAAEQAKLQREIYEEVAREAVVINTTSGRGYPIVPASAEARGRFLIAKSAMDNGKLAIAIETIIGFTARSTVSNQDFDLVVKALLPAPSCSLAVSV